MRRLWSRQLSDRAKGADGDNTRECSWRSMRAPDGQSDKASVHGVLDADKTSLDRSAVARLHHWAVDRPDIEYAVRVCSKSTSSPRVNNWQRRKRVARCVKGCPDTGFMLEWQTAPSRLIVQSDSDCAGDTSMRESVSAGNIRYGQHLLCTWSKDQIVIATSSAEAELYAACMAAQQAMGTENMARELGVHLDAMELQVDANEAVGIIGRQGMVKSRHLDLSYLWLQPGVRGKRVNLMKVTWQISGRRRWRRIGSIDT